MLFGYAEIKAITAANPRIKQKMEIDAEISRLRVLEGQYRKNLYALQDKVCKEFPNEIHRCEQKIQRAQEDLSTIKACRPEDAEQFSILVCGKRYTDKKEGGKALMDALFESKSGTVVAEYCGLKIALEPMYMFGEERSVSLSSTGQYSMHIGESASGNLTRLDNFLDDFPAIIERAKQRIVQLRNDLKVAEAQVQKPFEHKERLDALLREQSELNTELDIGQIQEIVVADETQAPLDSDDDIYVALPSKVSARSTHHRVQQRKPVDGYLLRAYNKEQKETPDAYLFVHNGNSYDLIGEQSSEITTAEFTALVGGTTEEDYARVADNGWHYASVPATGKIMALENSMLFRMPKGEYERYAYTIPSPFIRYNGERDSYAIGIPEDFTVSMKDNKSNDTVTMTAESFIAEIKGKTESDYESVYRRPSEESKKRFAAVEERLRQGVPAEMKARPNWVVVRTQENEEKRRADTFMIDVHMGKSAQADDPNTWTDFDTACEYARENGGMAIGYALDGNDQVACIDIDKCFAENGDMTPLAAEVFKKGNGTYAEKSVSGNGLHVFGKTDGMNLRAFGKDGDLAFYRKSHFVAMTGDNYGSSELKSLDTPDMKALLERKCEKRKEWNGAGKDVEGLSAMGDRDVVEKSSAAAKGDVFSALYRGEDLKKNREKSDMSLMNRLAFWCNGDKEQMLRIFATSGLYRSDKSPDYYENAAIKAVQDTVDRYQPKDKPSDKPGASKPSGHGSGKR